MFQSPFYHPYRKPPAPSSPAGLRLGDFVPRRRCFNLFHAPNFTDARSPDPIPTSPVKDAPSPADDGPPTARLDDLHREPFTPPERPAAPFQNRSQNLKRNIPSTRRKHKQHSPKKEDPSSVPSDRQYQQLNARQEAFRRRYAERYERHMLQGRQGLARLRREAELIMKPEHMNEEDHVFLEQLRKLERHNMLEHDLERYRRQVARAAEETDERRRAYEAWDAEAERLRARKLAEDTPTDAPEDAPTDAPKVAPEGAPTDAPKVAPKVVPEDALEDQKKISDSFIRRENEAAETRLRRMEEEAMRADEKRQRAHQEAERKIREFQEQCFHEEKARKAKEEEDRRREEEARRLREEREREERERRLREYERRILEEIERARQAQKERQRRQEEERRAQEEIERIRREAQERQFRERKERLERELREEQARVHAARLERERILRETRERLAREEEERLRAERARRTTEEEQIRQYFAIYEAKWNELRTSTCLPPIDVDEMPWPVFGVVVSADQITAQFVKTFLFHPLRPGVEGKTARDKVKSEVLRFHPDKFNTRIVPKIKPSQQAVAQAIAGALARILTTLMTEEV